MVLGQPRKVSLGVARGRDCAELAEAMGQGAADRDFRTEEIQTTRFMFAELEGEHFKVERIGKIDRDTQIEPLPV